MPGIELFNRRWNIGSDDLFYPCILELGARVLWISLHVSFYLESRQTFSCAQDSLTSLLHYYYISFFAIATALALDTLLIVIISTRGTITNSRPRRHVRPLLYARLLLYFMDLLCSVLGLYLLFTIDWAAQQCSKFILASMIANCVFCWLGIIVLVIPGIILLDPISHLPERDVAQKRRILYQRIKRLFFCCTCCLYDTAGSASRSLTYENSYKQISNLLEMIFRGGDLTPSDVLAGIILLSNKEIDQYKREGLIYAKQMKKNQQKLSSRPPIVNIDDDEDEANEEGEGSRLRRGNNNKEPAAWMNVNEASHYVRYAVACYSWPYYLYMNSLKGLNDLYCSSSLLACCCGCCGGRPDVPDSGAAASNTTEVDGGQGATEATRNVAEAEVEAAIAQAVIHGDPSRNHMKAFKILARVDECDVVYANFNNELFFVPFCILVDHAKKAVVIAIRGTLSMRDVITDITAECGYFDVDHLVQQPVHIGILNTAENILQTIETHDLLKESFRRNPDYKLLVTGHSLGAGTAVILSLKLKKEYPNVRCIAYSPPGGLISKDLADYSRSFIMSVIVGDDIVPRLSIRSVHNLKADILKELYSCEMPKYKILWKYSISCFRSPTPDTERQENGEAEASSESSSGVSSGNNSMLIDGDDVEDQYLQHAAATTSANVTTVQPGAVLDNEDDDRDQDKLKLSSNSGSSQRKLIVFNESDEIIQEDEKKKEELPKKTLFKAAAMAVARESQERLRSARKILRLQNGGEAASSSAASEAAAAAKAEAEDTLNKPIKSVQDCVAAYQKVKKMMHTVYTTYPDLQLPGHILYIYRIHNATFGNPNNHPTSRRICSRLCSCCKRTSPDRVKPDELAEYDSRWADRDEFKKILITNRIIMDHFPNTVDNALKYFSNSSGPYLGTASSRSSTAAFIS